MKRILLIHLILILVAGCSHIPKLDDVLPDKRTEYKKSEALPDLEVPPDLTAASKNESMSVPGERQATLSEYKKEKSQLKEQTQNRIQARAEQPAPQQESYTVTPAAAPSENQWVAVRGSNQDIWPKLHRFFSDKGYTFDLDDPELGVLSTNWSGPDNSSGSMSRNRYKVFTEAGADPDVVVLYVTCERQEQLGNDWADRGEDVMAGKMMVGELNLYFNNSSMQIAPEVAAVPESRSPARLEDSGDGKLILVIPDEFTYAWRQTGTVLQQSGLVINKENQDRGIYTVYYHEGSRKKKGWISKLAFWKGDDGDRGKLFQISLTGMGNKTELIVLDEAGSWRNDPQANNLLRMIESRYNSL